MNLNWSYSPETPNLGQNRQFFSRVTLKFDGWLLKTRGHLFYATSSFVHHFVAALVNSNWSYSPETPNVGQIRRFLEPCDLEIWPSKPIGHLFYATSSFVHHFVAIGEFKLELESGNAQSGSNLTIFRAVWPWNLTFKTNRSPVLCNFKLCASFCSHWWIQSAVTVQKRPIWVKFDDF